MAIRNSRLAECCEIVSGGTPNTTVEGYWNGEICWATPKDLSDLSGHYISDTPRKLSSAGLSSCAATILPPYSVLFSSRAPIGHVAINTVPMATNQGFKSFVPKDGVTDAKYLFHWLRYKRPYLESLGNGATFKEVSKAIISKVEVPLPPLPEQRRIAAILDKADALRAKRREALAQLDRLTQSIFIEMFGEPMTNPKGWECQRLGDIVKTTSGGTPDRGGHGYYGGAIPWVKSGELHQRLITETEECITELGLAKSSAKRMPPGTVLVAMYGATVGAVSQLAIYAATNQAICCMQPSKGILAPYLIAFLKQYTPILLSWRVGGAQPNLSQDLLRNIQVPLPPVAAQVEFSRRLESVHRLESEHQKSKKMLEVLFTSLQHRAFRGEL